MKKAFFLAAVAAVAGFALLASGNLRRSDDLFQENLEVLADGEGWPGFGPMCSQTGTPGTYIMKLCSSCSGGMGYYAMDYVAFCTK